MRARQQNCARWGSFRETTERGRQAFSKRLARPLQGSRTRLLQKPRKALARAFSRSVRLVGRQDGQGRDRHALLDQRLRLGRARLAMDGAFIGLAQVQKEGKIEKPLLTAGKNLETVKLFLSGHNTEYSAADVIEWFCPVKAASATQ